jgi:prepilin-type N-terminal cleavage/methylation domain-containing protein
MIGAWRTIPRKMTQGSRHFVFRRPTGFTLIEIIAAIVIMALLASAASLSFTQPLRIAREQDAIDMLRSFDSTARQLAVRLGHPVRCTFDLNTATLSREEEGSLRYQARLPRDCHLREVRTAARRVSDGEVDIFYSHLGISRSYALRLSGPGFDRWLLVPGLGAECTLIQNEAQLDSIFAATATRSEPGNQDFTPGDDAD